MTLPNSVPAESQEPSAQNIPGNGQIVQATPVGGAHGSPLGRPSRLPQAQRRSALRRSLLPGGTLFLLVVVFAAWFFFFRGAQARTDLVTAKVERRHLQLKVSERGSLEAIENHDIKCEVKTGSRGAPKIKSVVDNGELVKKGDLLVEIDDSYLQEQATTQKIARDKAESDMIAAKELYPAKKIAITLAQQNLDKWTKGDYFQQLHDYEGQIQISESTLSQQKDRTAWVARMVKKGYMTASQEESEKANQAGDELDLQKKQELRAVLTKYTNPVQVQTLENAILQAKVDERTAYANQVSTEAIFEQQDAVYKDLKSQIEQCKVIAPHSGIVVYSVPEQTMRGSGSNQSIIAQGEPVQFGQKMMSIPDLSHMQVNVRIHEAFINHLDVRARVEGVNPEGPAEKSGLDAGDVITKIDGKRVKSYRALVEALRGFKAEQTVKLTVQRKKGEFEVELTFAPRLANQPGVIAVANPGTAATGGRGGAGDPATAFGAQFQEGLEATVRVEAVPGKELKGHVKSVANVAAQQDWMSPDVKVYQAYVQIDADVKELELKPGLSAVCTIFTEAEANDVLAVPVSAVLSPLEKGGKPRCFVLTAKGPEARDVVTGLSDEKYIEIKSGVEEGEQVILNPRAVLSDKDKKATKEDEKSLGGRGPAQPGAGRGGKPGGGQPPAPK